MLTHKDITKPLVRRLLTLAFLSIRSNHHIFLKVTRNYGHSQTELKYWIWKEALEYKERIHAQVLMAIHMQHCPDIP